MANLTELERRALNAAVEGSDAWRKQLQEQIENLEVVSRDDSGAGVFTNFELKPGVPTVDIPASRYRDPPEVHASHPAIRGGATFLVWLKDGRVDCLEMALATGQTPVPDEDAFVFEKSPDGR
jgi:hypothetical protein